MSLAYKLLILAAVLGVFSCGIKGKPLPPLQQPIQSVTQSTDQTKTK